MFIKPMLCQTGQPKDLQRKGWVGEVKFDGTRAFLIKTKDSFMIQNRRGIDYTRRLPEITQEGKNVDETYVLDGELCYFNAEGISEFTPCQRRCSTQNLRKIYSLRRQYPLNFLAFDILQLNGEDLRRTPYEGRKEEVEELLMRNAWLEDIRYVKHTERATWLFEEVVKRGGEGVILKRLNSVYREGVRSYDWLKIREFHEAVCQVVGYTEGNNRRSKWFGSLVLTQNGKYVGNCGGGFSDRKLGQITALLKSCPRIPPPFKIDEPYTAVKTSLTVQVRYFERTQNGVFRFPSFLSIADNQQSTLFLG